MIKSKAKYVFGTAFDVAIILLIAALGFLIYECRQEVDFKKSELLKCISNENPNIQATINSSLVFTGGASPTKNVTTNQSVIATKAKELEAATLKLGSLATVGLVLAVILVTGYKTQEYLFFKKPKRNLIAKLTQSLTSNDVSSNGNDLRKRSLTELVEMLLLSRSDSEKFISEITKGNLDYEHTFSTQDKSAQALLSMQQKLRTASIDEKKVLWINESLASLENVIKNNAEHNDFHSKLISFIAQKISSSVGGIYIYQPEEPAPCFQLTGSYGYVNGPAKPKIILAGNGQLGQLAKDPRVVQLNNIPSKYLTIQSGLGAMPATHVLIVPLIFKEKLYGAIELAGFNETPGYQIQWLEKVAESVAAYLFNKKITSEAKAQLEKLAEQQAAELVQIHALQRKTNEHLQIQLKNAEDERLKNQAILEGCVDGVISFDLQGKIIFCNKSFLDIVGKTRTEWMTANAFELLSIELKQLNGKVQPFYSANNIQKPIQIRTEASLVSSNGDIVDVLITSTEVSVNEHCFFTFFIQKISVDLF